MKKWIIIIAIVLILGGGITWYFLQKSNNRMDEQSQIQTTTVKKGNLEVAVSGSGTISAISDEDLTAAKAGLIIDSVSVTSGEEVSKGETLLTFANGETVLAPVDGEISSVLVKSGQIAFAGTVLMRLTDEDSISTAITRTKSENDNMATNSLIVDTIKVSEGDVIKKGATVVSFTDGSIVQAPFDGTITTINVASGNTVDNASPLAHMTDYSSLQTTISVDELDISKVKEKQEVAIQSSAFEEETFKGVVTSVAKEGTTENGVSSFSIIVRLTEPKNLKIGMSIEASIQTANKDNILYVPVEAVYTSGSEKYVLKSTSTAETGQKQTVQIGIANDQYVEITSGLSEGDIVQLPQVKASNKTNESFGPGGFNGGQMPNGGGFGEPPSGFTPTGGQRGGN